MKTRKIRVDVNRLIEFLHDDRYFTVTKFVSKLEIEYSTIPHLIFGITETSMIREAKEYMVTHNLSGYEIPVIKWIETNQGTYLELFMCKSGSYQMIDNEGKIHSSLVI